VGAQFLGHGRVRVAGVRGRVNFFARGRLCPSKEGTAVRRFVRRVFMLSVVVGTAYVVWRWFESRRSDSGLSWEAQPAPFPPRPRVENPPVPATPVSKAEPVTETEPAR